jgi:AraC-like DNA-binding protein
MAVVGPLQYFFFRSLFDSSFRWRIGHYCHLLPGVLVLALAVVHADPWIDWAYYVFTMSCCVYIGIVIVLLRRNRNLYKLDDLKWRWMAILTVGMVLLACTFVLQLFFYDPLVYKLIVIAAAAVFYSLSIWIIPRAKLLFADGFRKDSDVKLYEDLGKRITTALLEKELYTDPTLTVTKLGAMIKVPGYLVSRAVNHCFEKSFSELITEFRIRKAEKLLRSGDTIKQLTIEAVAYESGFNTLSSFYSSFKKLKKITPAQFRSKSV